MTMRMMIAASLLLLTGCTAADTELETPKAPGETIRFTAGRCFGACPAYSLRVTPDGSGLLEPEKFTAVPGPTRFTVTPLQYRKLRASLAPYRPETGTEKRIGHNENCTRFATDMPTYAVEWTGGMPGKTTRLNFQSGCMDPRYGRLRTAIAAIPKLLEIEKMLKAPAAKK
ncbi:DUF6438 domain-containing protein [Sphingobium sp. CR2-8]|uniref:DUF6438 domain-containing protein n=1 Tax=Sphingobium sp. CR2-8 TaxID=1306534 RepID=UPI002DBD45A9|nr:DUF6438 domain-containing protein [Sphingobium sp. CR2-8]MEC3910243.1 DUF6438 domain-containing protein [Sphingobium sp. CR2-8]